MHEFTIDSFTTKVLVGQGDTLPSLDKNIANDVRGRLMTIGFDCTPNWGIKGTRDSKNAVKRNWYLRDPQQRQAAIERYKNIDPEKVKPILAQAVSDFVGVDAQLIGFGMYGSYFYRRNALLPEDLDIFVLVDGVRNVAIDALRYRDTSLKDIYINKAKIIPKSDEFGISIVSTDCLRPDNPSYVITDCSLVDISTTFSHGQMVDAKDLPPFVISLNAQKIVHWGISSILDKPFSLLSRIDEAIRMRNMLLTDHPEIELDKFAIENSLPSKEDILLGMNDAHFLEMSRALVNVLHQDEMKIREHIARNFRGS